jgi:hypothetical protein
MATLYQIDSTIRRALSHLDDAATRPANMDSEDTQDIWKARYLLASLLEDARFDATTGRWTQEVKK